MKIRLLVNLLSTFALLLLTIALFRVYNNNIRLQQLEADQNAVQDLMTITEHLRFMLTESLLYREQRANDLWHKKQQHLRESLAEHRYSEEKQNFLAARIQERQQSVDVLYRHLNELSATSETTIFNGLTQDEGRARVVSLLLIATQEILDDARSIGRINQTQGARLSQARRNTFLVVIGLVSVILLAFVLVLRRSVLEPIRQLKAGTDIITGGQLDYRVYVRSRNELGELSNRFNLMTAQLQESIAALKEEIAERKAAQTKAQTSETRLRQVMDTAFIGIVHGDRVSQLSFVNRTFADMVGLSPEAIIESDGIWKRLGAPNVEESLRITLRELEECERAHPFECSLQDAAGQAVPVMIGLARMAGKTGQWVGFVLDLSERHRIEKIQREFISVVSHELRTPLTSIRGALALLEQGLSGALSVQAQKLVSIAHGNSLRLGKLIDDILDMDKLISGKVRIQPQLFVIDNVLRQAVAACSSYASQRGIEFILAEPQVPYKVYADPSRVEQVLANLLSNAAKFSPEGGKVDIRIVAAPNQVRVEVKDHGKGVPQDFHSRIFEAFAQADSDDTRRQGGTGLGLKISKTLVENMGGEMGFFSAPGNGAVFWFALPDQPPAVTETV